MQEHIKYTAGVLIPKYNSILLQLISNKLHRKCINLSFILQKVILYYCLSLEEYYFITHIIQSPDFSNRTRPVRLYKTEMPEGNRLKRNLSYMYVIVILYFRLNKNVSNNHRI